VQGVFGGSASLLEQATSALGNVAPYHWLDYIANRALYASVDVGDVTQATGYSFTRASQGYYTNSDGTLTSFASGALRRGDRGVLIEGSRTNLLTYSQEFDDAAWGKTRSSITVNATTAPDGTLTADKLVEDTSTNTHFVLNNSAVTVTSGAPVAYSVFLKASERTIAQILDNDLIGATFDLSSGVATDVPAGVTATITALANGWYRCTMARDAGSVNGRIVVRLVSTGTTSSYTGDGTSGIFIWGAQLEQASFQSSYVPTVAAAATRAADSLSYTAGVSYPASLWAEFSQDVLAGGGSNRIFQIDDGSINNRATLYMSTNVVTFRVSTSGSNVATVLVSGAISASVVYKAAGRAETDDVRVYRNATQGTQDTSAALPASPTTARVGVGVTTDEELFGYIRRVAVFNSALTDAQLQTVTGS
jgi:hypothetical protein